MQQSQSNYSMFVSFFQIQFDDAWFGFLLILFRFSFSWSIFCRCSFIRSSVGFGSYYRSSVGFGNYYRSNDRCFISFYSSRLKSFHFFLTEIHSLSNLFFSELAVCSSQLRHLPHKCVHHCITLRTVHVDEAILVLII